MELLWNECGIIVRLIWEKYEIALMQIWTVSCSSHIATYCFISHKFTGSFHERQLHEYGIAMMIKYQIWIKYGRAMVNLWDEYWIYNPWTIEGIWFKGIEWNLRVLNRAVWGLMMAYHTGTFDRAVCNLPHQSNRIDMNRTLSHPVLNRIVIMLITTLSRYFKGIRLAQWYVNTTLG